MAERLPLVDLQHRNAMPPQTHSISLKADVDRFDTLVDLALNLLGVIGIIMPFANAVSPIYANSGYVPANDYQRLGAIFGPSFSPCPGSNIRSDSRSAPGADTEPKGEDWE